MVPTQTQCGPTVKVFTAGDHFAGMENPTESKELVEALLNRAGYTKGYEWECRIDKLKHCSSESRPVRVIGYKNYGVIMRLKPHVYATIDYQATLMIPHGSGYSSKNLFEQLKANEKSISRVIRQREGKEKEASMTNHIPPAPSPFTLAHQTVEKIEKIPEFSTPITGNPEEYRPTFKTLQGVIKSIDKLKYILMKIKHVNSLDFCRNKIQFTETLKHECKWDKEGHSKNAVGRVLTELVKHDYLMETVNERDKIIGYSITRRGLEFIALHKDDKPLPEEETAPRKEEIKYDIPAVLINMRDKLQELSDVANKIAANNAERAELLRKVDLLDAENTELSKIMESNKECQDVLHKLEKLVVPLQLHGTKHSDS
jgi:hypothetical protein